MVEIDQGGFRVHLPTLVIWGERDHAVLVCNLSGIDQHFAPLRGERITGASRRVMHERPARMHTLMQDVLAV